MLIDAHLDLAMNALLLGRDLTGSALDTRAREGENPRCGNSTVGLADLRRGDIGICFATVSVLACRAWIPPGDLNFRSPDDAHQQGRDQIAYYRSLEADGQIRILTDRASLESHLENWQSKNEEQRQHEPIGVVFLLEGAYPIREPAELSDWFNWGVRIIGLSWAGSDYAGGTYGPGRLTQKGRELLAGMQRAGVILDISHLNDSSFYDVLDAYEGPVLGSHVNCRALVPGDRQLTDQMIRALIERDAVLGTACDTWMVVPGWKKKVTSPATCPMDRLVDHIDHVCQLAGNSRHAAIGSDLDGGYGTEQSPGDLDTIADLSRLPELMSARGFSDDDIAAITHGNWIRKLRSAWKT
ncbi:MAG: membrane dipeptidase [Planctomycetaceae bacterium]